MINLTDAENAFNKNLTTLPSETLSKISIEGRFYNIFSEIYKETNASINSNRERLEAFPLYL